MVKLLLSTAWPTAFVIAMPAAEMLRRSVTTHVTQPWAIITAPAIRIAAVRLVFRTIVPRVIPRAAPAVTEVVIVRGAEAGAEGTAAVEAATAVRAVVRVVVEAATAAPAGHLPVPEGVVRIPEVLLPSKAPPSSVAPCILLPHHPVRGLLPAVLSTAPDAAVPVAQTRPGHGVSPTSLRRGARSARIPLVLCQAVMPVVIVLPPFLRFPPLPPFPHLPTNLLPTLPPNPLPVPHVLQGAVSLRKEEPAMAPFEPSVPRLAEPPAAYLHGSESFMPV